ncbi:hypothetical protein [Yinghuangia seranimata]|uniref:hypothetical protein n=1 Tax=Yinghuangia seranimata TaxID=408067 RepID=UPI00248BC5FE|nr:hypothetical protein [Yinghuangia seranimata]MDI2132953.1 hypothetical protein [Yinghuangia seranimata]
MDTETRALGEAKAEANAQADAETATNAESETNAQTEDEAKPEANGAAPPLDPSRSLALHPLTYLDEGDEVTVGRADVDSYCVLPADGAALLRRLEEGSTPNDAATWYAETYGQPVDIQEFLEVIDELGFVVGPDEQPADTAPPRLQGLGRALFSWPARAAYAALLLASVVVMARDHSLIPSYHHLFFSPYIMVIVATLYFGEFPLVVLHECFHALAGRRLGLHTRFGFGRRLYFVVMETTMDGLVAVPRRRRYWPILAGMFADLLVVAVFTLAAAAVQRDDGSQPIVGAVLLALAFGTLLRFVWQFYFYLQTDIYYAVVTVLGCVDLQKTAKVVVRNRVRRLLGRRATLVDESTLHPTDRRAARWYSWLMVAGYAFSLGTLAVAGLPTMFRIATIMIDRLRDGTGPGGLADSLLFLGVNVAQFAVVGYIALRDRRRRRAAPATTHLVA